MSTCFFVASSSLQFFWRNFRWFEFLLNNKLTATACLSSLWLSISMMPYSFFLISIIASPFTFIWTRYSVKTFASCHRNSINGNSNKQVKKKNDGKSLMLPKIFFYFVMARCHRLMSMQHICLHMDNGYNMQPIKNISRKWNERQKKIMENQKKKI